MSSSGLILHTFRSQELGLCCGVLGVDETGRVYLDLVHVDSVGANLHQHLVTVTSGVGTVGGGQVEGVGPVLLQQRVLCEVGSVATGRENDWALECGLLAVEGVCDTSGAVALGVDRGDLGLLDELNALRLCLGQLLESLHQSVCDGHTGELGIVATVSSGLGVSTVGLLVVVEMSSRMANVPQPRNERQVEVEDIHQPLNGSGGLVGQDLDQIRPRLVSRRLECVIVELLDAVADLVVNLCPCESTVDSRCGFGGVASHEVCACEHAIGCTGCATTHCSCQGERHCLQQGRWCEQRSGRTLALWLAIKHDSARSEGQHVQPAPTTMTLCGMVMVDICEDGERERWV